jgi:hypothetical protein
MPSGAMPSEAKLKALPPDLAARQERRDDAAEAGPVAAAPEPAVRGAAVLAPIALIVRVGRAAAVLIAVADPGVRVAAVLDAAVLDSAVPVAAAPVAAAPGLAVRDAAVLARTVLVRIVLVRAVPARTVQARTVLARIVRGARTVRSVMVLVRAAQGARAARGAVLFRGAVLVRGAAVAGGASAPCQEATGHRPAKAGRAEVRWLPTAARPVAVVRLGSASQASR